MIKAILFDLDGVLVDACRMHQVSFNRALMDVAGFSIGEDEHISYFNGLPTKKKLEALIKEGRVKEKDKEEIFSLKQKYTIEEIPNTIFPSYHKQKMHERIKRMGIEEVCVTNSIQKTAELMLIASLQLQYMKFLISNEDVAAAKPSPEGYRLAMERLSMDPGDVLIVEDSPHGIEAAKASGGHVLSVKGHEEVVWETIEEELDRYGN